MSNYTTGRTFEYETMREWEKRGYACTRASGSHSSHDIIAYRLDRVPEMIQCKVVSSTSQAERLIAKFVKDIAPSKYYHQVIYVKVKRVGTLGRTV